MPILPNYQHFSGRHPETGSLHNALAYQGVTAPHTGQPYSEALLLGISGGIAFGYFVFQYAGHLPILALLTRNTFDPMQTVLERIGIVQTVLQTASAEKGFKNLLDTLENGRPAIVWADVQSLPYNCPAQEDNYWAMMPLVVYGHDGEQAYLADRSSRPLLVPAETLHAARARIKKDKFRVLSLDPPNPERLQAAVSSGLWQCIRLFTEKPPRGTARNFGVSALKHWASMLTNTRNPQGWTRAFPPGPAMFAALAGNGGPMPGLYGWALGWGDGGAERARYADFLDEAARILNRPALRQVAVQFRHSHAAWRELAALALPDSAPSLAEARRLHDRRARLFWEQGGEALPDLQELARQQRALAARMEREFPLDETQAADFRAALAIQVLKIYSLEEEAVTALRDAMA
ncbi:MAG: hypothetical protein HYZ26_02185 [Chloroflexi bacterium]|nr:hypothetical protein [Chloroflexota bacterium]